MTATIIWATAFLIYAAFWLWYVGFKAKVTKHEIAKILELIKSSDDYSEAQLEATRHFFANDDGKDFVMVNLLELKEPKAINRKKLEHYQKIFLGNLLKRAGHPVFIARAASGNFESLNSESANNWTAAGMIRYRSRRDLLEVLPETIGSEHHNLKLESLQKTFAFPGAPWTLFGGPKLIVPLTLALLAALMQLALA